MAAGLTSEQISALRTYAAEHGRTWKASLRADWETDARRAAGPLRQLRNTHGPAWLAGYRLPRAGEMTRHQLTKVQRQVLTWMQESEFVVRIETGYKTTTCTITEHGESIIRCQSFVPHFLRSLGYIEQAGGISAWQLTEKGTAAVARGGRRS